MIIGWFASHTELNLLVLDQIFGIFELVIPDRSLLSYHIGFMSGQPFVPGHVYKLCRR